MSYPFQTFSKQVEGESPVTPKKLSESVRNKLYPENVVPHISPELRVDIEKLRKTELRIKYSLEASSHRNMMSRAKLGYVIHPNFQIFSSFLLHVGLRPGPDYTLDRIDSSDPEYAPGKVRWVCKSAQTHNRTNTRYLENSKGENLTAAEWERRKGVPAKVICERVDRLKWTVDEATEIPVGEKRSRLKSNTQAKAYSSSTPLVGVWQQLLDDHHGQKFCSFTAAEKKMIKDLANRYETGALPACEVFTCILTNWRSFTDYAQSHYGAFGNIPEVPTLHFLVKWCNASGNFYLSKKRDMEAKLRQTMLYQEAVKEFGENSLEAALAYFGIGSDER